MNIKPALALLLLFCILLPALGQNKPAPPPPPQQAGDQDDVVKINTNLVQVDAVVTKAGKMVTDLTADDFEIFEDGRRQTITSFAYISNVPASASQPASPDKKSAAPYAPVKRDEPHRTVAFVVDDLGLSAESMYQVKKQLRKFIAEDLQPNDLVAILRTSGELGALQQFTNDKRLLNRAVDQVRWNYCSRARINVIPQVGDHDNGTLICGFRSILVTMKSMRFIIDAMGHLPGRKSLVLLSDSMPRETQDEFAGGGRAKEVGTMQVDALSMGPETIDHTLSLHKIAEKAIRSSVVIYSVDTQGLQYTGLTAADNFRGGPNQMRDLIASRSKLLVDRREGGDLIARQTGGFQIRNTNSYQLDRIVEDQSGYYLLGYRPTDETFNRRFHQIKAKVKRSGMTLRTRFGFYGVSEEEANRAKPTPRDQTNLALASPFMAQDLDLDMSSFFINDTATGSLVRSFIYIDAKDLTLTGVNGRYQGAIELHGVVFGENGVIVAQVSRGATLNLPESDYQFAINQGLRMSFDIPVKRPGAFQVRVVARDQPSSRIGSAGQYVLVPDLKNKKLAVSGILLAENGANQTITNPGTTRFRPNSELYFACLLYNAANESGKLRNLVMDVTLFRDDKKVYSGPQTPIVASDQTDLSRVVVKGVLRLTPELEPGNYYLQIVITDKDASSKKVAPVVQWVDFDIVK
jgi:VWFA-related protein